MTCNVTQSQNVWIWDLEFLQFSFCVRVQRNRLWCFVILRDLVNVTVIAYCIAAALHSTRALGWAVTRKDLDEVLQALWILSEGECNPCKQHCEQSGIHSGLFPIWQWYLQHSQYAPNQSHSLTWTFWTHAYIKSFALLTKPRQLLRSLTTWWNVYQPNTRRCSLADRVSLVPTTSSGPGPAQFLQALQIEFHHLNCSIETEDQVLPRQFLIRLKMPSFPKLLSSWGFNVTTVPPNNQLRVMVKTSGRF